MGQSGPGAWVRPEVRPERGLGQGAGAARAGCRCDRASPGVVAQCGRMGLRCGGNSRQGAGVGAAWLGHGHRLVGAQAGGGGVWEG